jgi:hypothetical protein
VDNLLVTLPTRVKRFNKPVIGAAREKIRRWHLILLRSIPLCKRKATSPNEAGALCSMIAKNTINWRELLSEALAAPRI